MKGKKMKTIAKGLSTSLFIVAVLCGGFWAGVIYKESQPWSHPTATESQIYLQAKGYYTGDIDGDYGRLSVTALESYSNDKNAARWFK